MYKNKRFNKNAKQIPKTVSSQKRPLKTIDENATAKSVRIDESNANATKAADNEKADELMPLFDSEENIPASQEPTQRFLSQRSVLASTLVRTQSRTQSRPPNNYFELFLIKAGVLLDEGNTFVLSCDHVAFVIKFRELFIKAHNYPDNIETFKMGLRDALSANSKYRSKLLSGCTINASGEQEVYQSQDSMIINFLTIDFLRDEVLEVLLDKIEEAAVDSVPRFAFENVPLLQSMLAQLRYVATSHVDIIYERISKIFEKASDNGKWDIIANAENIIDSSKHNEFAQLLLDSFPESKELFKTITVQTLINLGLNHEMQGKLHYRILNFIKNDQCPNSTFPLLIRFLLKDIDQESEDSIRELVKTLREILIFYMDSSIKNDKQSQLELFTNIEQALTRSKRFYSIWQKTLLTLPLQQFRSLDFIISILLISIREDNSLYIENILRQRIKQNSITVEVLNETKEKYSSILEQHADPLMQILHDFLGEKHKAVSDFARSAHVILFEICDSVQKYVLKKLLELTCDKSANSMTNLALELLRDLQRRYPTQIQNWGLLLMPLLDRLNDLSLSQTRLVMELLCSIAFPGPLLSECVALQEQIDMLVKKQIINRLVFVKKQGIIGSVQLIDSIARVENSHSEDDALNTTYECVSDLPDGRGKIAANYVVRIHSSTMHCPELLALFYDELATVCATTGNTEELSNHAFLDRSFLIWFSELMTCYFQNNFIAENVDPESLVFNGIRLSAQKCINSMQDMGDMESEMPEIAINISELVLKPTAEANSSIMVLSPLFNLVRVLHLLRNKGSLEVINALLGCAIILPTFFDSDNTDSIFLDYDEDLQRKILDIYFHCVNWMRETVSSFATQREEMLRRKVLQRLVDLIKIEGNIRKLLLKAPDNYVPPICQFINSHTKVAAPAVKSADHDRPAPSNTMRPKGNRKANQTVNDSMTQNDNINPNNQTSLTLKLAAAGKTRQNSTAKAHFDSLYGPKEIYRQMDSNIMLILNEKFVLCFPLPEERIGQEFGLLEFRFILTDLVNKLESITGIQKFQSEQTLQYIAKPHYFISDLSKFLNKIVDNMNLIFNSIKQTLEKVEYAYGHGDLFTSEFGYLKVCFGLCLRLLAAYFSWSGFADPAQSKLLKESLVALLPQPTSPNNRHNATPDSLAIEAFKQFLTYEPTIVDLKTAVHLYQLMGSLRKHASAGVEFEALKKLESKLYKLCQAFLQRKWFNYDTTLEKGAHCNIYLDELVKGFLRSAKLTRQKEILIALIEEIKPMAAGRSDSSLSSFPNIKKANFPILYRGICEVMISSVRDAIATHDVSDGDKLQVWETSIELLNMLLHINKSVDIPRNFQSFLKHSHLYLKMLLQHGLKIFEQYLRQNPDRVSHLLRALQVTTRFLHHLCCHSKTLKNTSIINQIPALRETVEIIVYRVKALLAAHKCSSVFWMGPLRNKDIKGGDIVSQSATLSTTANEENSDEEIPEDDVSIEESIAQQQPSTDQSSIPREDSAGNDNNSKSSTRSKCF